MSVASTLTEKAFADRRRREWEELDSLTQKTRRRGGLKKLTTDEVVRMSPLYRSVCADLAAAEAARLQRAARRLFAWPHRDGAHSDVWPAFRVIIIIRNKQ